MQIFVMTFLKFLHDLLRKPTCHVLHSPYRHTEREGWWRDMGEVRNGGRQRFQFQHCMQLFKQGQTGSWEQAYSGPMKRRHGDVQYLTASTNPSPRPSAEQCIGVHEFSLWQ